MQVCKNSQNNRLLRISERSNSILKSFAEHKNNWNEWILDKCEELSIGVFLRQGTTRQWYKGFLRVGEKFDASCNNRRNSE